MSYTENRKARMLTIANASLEKCLVLAEDSLVIYAKAMVSMTMKGDCEETDQYVERLEQVTAKLHTRADAAGKLSHSMRRLYLETQGRKTPKGWDDLPLELMRDVFMGDVEGIEEFEARYAEAAKLDSRFDKKEEV